MKTTKAKTPAKAARKRTGKLSAGGFTFAIVVSRFNQLLTQQLLAGASDALERLGANRRRVEVVEVPGAFEIPATARALGASGRFDAVICLGVILRGETPHFDAISREVARGVGQSALETGVPHAFGVLTCDTLKQAEQRAGLKFGNKGWDAAMAAVEMANLFAALKQTYPKPQP